VAHQTIVHGPSHASYLELQMQDSQTAH